MRTIAVIGRKGGSGKTTIAVHLAIGLHLRGCETVLADADPQQSAMGVFKRRREAGPQTLASSGPKLFALQTAVARSGAQALVIDTPAVLEEEIVQAVALCDIALLVVRPTCLDLAAAIGTSDIVSRLRKPGLIVISQAPMAPGPLEPASVGRAIEALSQVKMPIAPVVMRTRSAYQTALETGRSAEELASEPGASHEIEALCEAIDRFAAGPQPAAWAASAANRFRFAYETEHAA